jgi:hypothetical protein
MKVVATEDFTTYWNMCPVDIPEGAELDGALAAYLASSGAPVEVTDADEQTQPATPDPAGPVVSDSPPGNGQSQELDITATAASVLEWVGDDPQRAAEAHAAESAKDKPRSTLLKKLDEITGS